MDPAAAVRHTLVPLLQRASLAARLGEARLEVAVEAVAGARGE